MDNKDQELVVASIVTTLAAKFGDGEVGSGGKNHVLGASGFPHQIDVSGRSDSALWLYECKCWGRPVDSEAVLTFAARLIDIQAANPGISVHACLIGNGSLTKGGRTLAKYFDIEWQVVKSPVEFLVTFRNATHAGVHDTISFRDTIDAT